MKIVFLLYLSFCLPLAVCAQTEEKITQEIEYLTHQLPLASTGIDAKMTFQKIDRIEKKLKGKLNLWRIAHVHIARELDRKGYYQEAFTYYNKVYKYRENQSKQSQELCWILQALVHNRMNAKDFDAAFKYINKYLKQELSYSYWPSLLNQYVNTLRATTNDVEIQGKYTLKLIELYLVHAPVNEINLNNIAVIHKTILRSLGEQEKERAVTKYLYRALKQSKKYMNTKHQLVLEEDLWYYYLHEHRFNYYLISDKSELAKNTEKRLSQYNVDDKATFSERAYLQEFLIAHYLQKNNYSTFYKHAKKYIEERPLNDRAHIYVAMIREWFYRLNKEAKSSKQFQKYYKRLLKQYLQKFGLIDDLLFIYKMEIRNLIAQEKFAKAYSLAKGFLDLSKPYYSTSYKFQEIIWIFAAEFRFSNAKVFTALLINEYIQYSMHIKDYYAVVYAFRYLGVMFRENRQYTKSIQYLANSIKYIRMYNLGDKTNGLRIAFGGIQETYNKLIGEGNLAAIDDIREWKTAYELNGLKAEDVQRIDQVLNQ